MIYQDVYRDLSHWLELYKKWGWTIGPARCNRAVVYKIENGKVISITLCARTRTHV